MNDKRKRLNYKGLLCIPSFYGSISWGIWLVLYLLKLVKVNDYINSSMFIYISVEICFIISTLLFLNTYNNCLNRLSIKKINTDILNKKDNIILSLMLLHLLGICGILYHLYSLINYFGGLDWYTTLLVSEAGTIRGDREIPVTIGTQLSYFGWVAISLTLFEIKKKNIGVGWVLLVMMQFILNLLFLDRTRPMWIIFTTSMMLMLTVDKISLKKVFRYSVIALIAGVSVFWLIAEWTGKIYYEEKYDYSLLPGNLNEVYTAGVSGFAYFNEMLKTEEEIAYKPTRLAYPINKILSHFNIVDEPPSQVIEFYDVPFPTNVGTFLEPFYRDGWFFYVIIGIFIYSFGFNLLSLYLLYSGNRLAYYAWANVCFTVFIGFFTPKISSSPIWLFLIMGVFQIYIMKFIKAYQIQHRCKKTAC